MLRKSDRREAALTRTAKSLCAGPTTSSNLDSHMGEWKSCCVPDDVRPDDVRYARNKFFKHSYNFLWALPSWKSLAIGSKMMGKITRKNIINFCSSYRPCPVRRNIEKSTLGKVIQTDRRPPGSPPVNSPGTSPLLPWTFQAFLPRFLARPCLELILRPHRLLQASWISVVSRLSHAESANLPKWKVAFSNPFRPFQGIHYRRPPQVYS